VLTDSRNGDVDIWPMVRNDAVKHGELKGAADKAALFLVEGLPQHFAANGGTGRSSWLSLSAGFGRSSAASTT
jgi:hypothetical protein